jgi:hypothetical protein
MIPRLLWTGCALIGLAVWSGCDTEGYVTDQSNIETYVKNVTLCGEKQLTIVSGGAVRTVPIEAISRIVMSNETSRTISGNLYFCGSVEFKDGSKLDARNKANDPLTLIDVGSSLCGESQKGHYSISLANVYKVILKSK